MGGGVDGGHRIVHADVRGEGEEAVGDAFRDIQGVAVFLAEFEGLPFAVAGRIRAGIHEAVPDGTGEAADEFDLSEGGGLEMHAAQGALDGRGGDAGLEPAGVEAGFAKSFIAPGADEVTAVVAAQLRCDAEDSREFGWMDFHGLETRRGSRCGDPPRGAQAMRGSGSGMMNLPPAS